MKHLLFPAIIFLFATTSCRKVFDFIRDHPDAHDSLCRITKINVTGAFNEPDEFDMSVGKTNIDSAGHFLTFWNIARSRGGRGAAVPRDGNTAN